MSKIIISIFGTIVTNKNKNKKEHINKQDTTDIKKTTHNGALLKK